MDSYQLPTILSMSYMLHMLPSHYSQQHGRVISNVMADLSHTNEYTYVRLTCLDTGIGD
jgi:hypothetical protein